MICLTCLYPSSLQNVLNIAAKIVFLNVCHESLYSEPSKGDLSMRVKASVQIVANRVLQALPTAIVYLTTLLFLSIY